jgi:hypothetical protein
MYMLALRQHSPVHLVGLPAGVATSFLVTVTDLIVAGDVI